VTLGLVPLLYVTFVEKLKLIRWEPTPPQEKPARELAEVEAHERRAM
jgi:hypothetical protein